MTLMAHPTMTQVETALAEVDRQLADHAHRTMVSNTEFVNAMLDVRNILDAYWAEPESRLLRVLREES